MFLLKPLEILIFCWRTPHFFIDSHLLFSFFYQFLFRNLTYLYWYSVFISTAAPHAYGHSIQTFSIAVFSFFKCHLWPLPYSLKKHQLYAKSYAAIYYSQLVTISFSKALTMLASFLSRGLSTFHPFSYLSNLFESLCYLQHFISWLSCLSIVHSKHLANFCLRLSLNTSLCFSLRLGLY